MKKSKLLMLLSSAIMLFVAMGTTSCVDDNDDLGMPYLEVTPATLKFDANGTAIGASEFVVKSNRPWTLDIPAEAQWVRPSVTSGEGDGTVSFNLFASNVGQSAKLTFALKNSAGYAYNTVEVTIEQGDAPKPGPIGDLVSWIIDNKIQAGPLNYPTEEIEAVILANNVYGNNFGKLYVGDNTTLPNSGMILYNTTDFNKVNSANYPVGKRVKLNLKDAEYAPFNNLREIKGVTVTVLDGDPETINYPTLSVNTFLEGNYQGQYVKILNVTPQAAYVGQAWATGEKRAVKMSSDGSEVQAYMSKDTDATDFATMTIADRTGAIFGAAEQIGTTIQIIPTKPSDVAELSVGGDEPAVTTGNATEVTPTSATLAGSSRNLDAATEVGVEYKLADATEWTKKAAAAVSADWTVSVTGLAENTKYTYRAYAVSGTTYTGAEKEFTTKGSSDADIMIDFSDPSIYPSNFPTAKGTGELATFQFGGYDFTFLGKVQSDGSGGYYKSAFGGETFLLYGKQGAYMGLPAVPGKALTKVVCTAPENASASVQVGVYDAADQPVSGGEAITWTKDATPRVYTYTLSGTAENTSYRLYIASKHNTNISKLELYYETGGSEPKPTITPSTASMEFESAADATGKTQEYELANASGLTLFADVADKTNFSAAVENGNTVRVKTLTANDGDAARTTTVTVYLAESANAEKKATATINVKQLGQSSGPVAITIPQLNALIAPATAQNEVLDADNDRVLEAIVMNDVAGGNYSYNNLILATEGSTAAGNGVTLYGSQVEPSTLGLNKGDKVRVTLYKGLAMVRNYNGMYEVTGDKEATWSKVEKISSGVNIPVATITPPQLADYQGMAVAIDNATVSAPGVWANADNISSHTFSAGGVDFTVFVKKGATAFLDKPYAAATGNIMGLAAVNSNKGQLVPRDMADVVAFNPTAPVITSLDPDALSWGSDETAAQTISVKGSDLSGKLSCSLSGGADSKFTASVSGTTVTVTPKGANETAADFEETLTVAVAGGNSMNATLKQAKKGSGGDKTLDINFADQGWENAQAIDMFTATPLTFTFAGGGNSNTPKYYTSGTALRMYSKNTMTITGATITKIEFTFIDRNELTTATGNLENGVWTGSSDNLVFTVDTANSKSQARIQKMVITYTE